LAHCLVRVFLCNCMSVRFGVGVDFGLAFVPCISTWFLGENGSIVGESQTMGMGFNGLVPDSGFHIGAGIVSFLCPRSLLFHSVTGCYRNLIRIVNIHAINHWLFSGVVFG
jgi:hypothetical protein